MPYGKDNGMTNMEENNSAKKISFSIKESEESAKQTEKNPHQKYEGDCNEDIKNDANDGEASRDISLEEISDGSFEEQPISQQHDIQTGDAKKDQEQPDRAILNAVNHALVLRSCCQMSFEKKDYGDIKSEGNAACGEHYTQAEDVKKVKKHRERFSFESQNPSPSSFIWEIMKNSSRRKHL